jgi:glycosyltransferase involved in cell wall biosynthesis
MAISRLESIGVACHEIPLNRTGLNPFADGALLYNLIGLMRRARPNLVIAYTAKPVIFGLLAARIARVPRRYALITGLGYAFTGPLAGKRRMVRAVIALLYRLALRGADRVFFQNPDDLAQFAALELLTNVRPVVVNGSGIDLAHFGPAPFPEGPVRFLLVARLLSAKGIREFAAAAAVLLQRHPDVQFHLLGGLDSNPDALDRIEVTRWHDDATLVWHGEVRDVRPHIAACHVFVLPSYREGTPRSVLEAMAMGRPIITTNAPGCRETVIDGRNGFLVEPQSVVPLAEAMERFVNRPELIELLGAASRAIAENKYDVHEVNAHMLREMDLD